jgi:Spy/CpxP family protein refolding chaperone
MTVKSSLFSLSFALVVLITAASVAQAQGQGGGRRGGRGVSSLTLLQSEQVQKELELTDDQKTSATKLADEYRPGGGGGGGNTSPEDRQKRREELQKKVNDILTPQQQQRLDEIVLQVSVKMQPSQALSDAKVAEKLQLTEDQKQQLTDITSEYRQKTMDLFQGGPPDRDAMDKVRDAMTKLRTEQSDKAMTVLTADQKDQLTKLQGKTIDIDASQLRGFGGRSRNRAGGGNGGGGNDGGGKDGNSGSNAQPDA